MRYTTRVVEGYLELRGATWRPPLDPDAVARLVSDDHLGHPYIRTGINMGPVDVEVRVLDQRPEPTADPGTWEEIAEISVEATEVPLLVVGGEDGLGPGARLDTTGPGTYRLRVHAAGRRIAYDAVVTEPVERYLVQAWPEEHTEPTPVALERAPTRSSSATVPPPGLEAFQVHTPPTAVPAPEPTARARIQIWQELRDRQLPPDEA